MIVLIRNIGCDDETLGLAYFSNAGDFNHFVKIIKDLNQNSNYPCMPIIKLYSLFENEIIEIKEINKKNKEELYDSDIIKWKNLKYTFVNPDLYFSIISDPERDILYKKDK